jgi:hypothetical protein
MGGFDRWDFYVFASCFEVWVLKSGGFSIFRIYFEAPPEGVIGDHALRNCMVAWVSFFTFRQGTLSGPSRFSTDFLLNRSV